MAKHHPDLIMCRKQPWDCHRAAVREVRRQVRGVRFLRAPLHSCAHLRRVQLMGPTRYALTPFSFSFPPEKHPLHGKFLRGLC